MEFLEIATTSTWMIDVVGVIVGNMHLIVRNMHLIVLQRQNLEKDLIIGEKTNEAVVDGVLADDIFFKEAKMMREEEFWVIDIKEKT